MSAENQSPLVTSLRPNSPRSPRLVTCRSCTGRSGAFFGWIANRSWHRGSPHWMLLLSRVETRNIDEDYDQVDRSSSGRSDMKSAAVLRHSKLAPLPDRGAEHSRDRDQTSSVELPTEFVPLEFGRSRGGGREQHRALLAARLAVSRRARCCRRARGRDHLARTRCTSREAALDRRP